MNSRGQSAQNLRRCTVPTVFGQPHPMTIIETTAREGVLRLYGVTEGSLRIQFIDVWNSAEETDCMCGGVLCDVCYHHGTSGGEHEILGYCCDAGPQLHMYEPTVDEPLVLVHEVGHMLLGLPDEYDAWDTWLDWCGESVMASASSVFDPLQLCANYNHGYEASAPVETPGSAWYWYGQSGTVPWSPVAGWSPDTVSFHTRTFSNQVGVVRRHW